MASTGLTRRSSTPSVASAALDSPAVVDPGRFEAMAAQYARARPPYPDALWESLRRRGLLRAGSRALDLGAGSGQATGPLLAAGLAVTAVEPGPRLAERLRESCPAAEVVLGRAEDVELPAGAFDLVVAATSVHWMDAAVLVPRVTGWLAPGGAFAVWRHVFGDDDVDTPFRREVARIVAHRDGAGRPGPDPQDAASTAAGLTASGLLELAAREEVRWAITLDESAVRLLFSTFSDWAEPEVDRAGLAVRALGGHVVEHYRTWLLVLRPHAG